MKGIFALIQYGGTGPSPRCEEGEDDGPNAFEEHLLTTADFLLRFEIPARGHLWYVMNSVEGLAVKDCEGLFPCSSSAMKLIGPPSTHFGRDFSACRVTSTTFWGPSLPFLVARPCGAY